MIRRLKLPRLAYMFKPIKRHFQITLQGGYHNKSVRSCYGSTRDVSRDRKSEKAHPEIGKGKSGVTNSGMFILRGAGRWLKLESC